MALFPLWWPDAMTHTDGRTTTRRLTDYAKIAITRQCKQLFELGAIKVALCLARNLGKLTLFNIMKLCKSYRINLENYFRITCELKKNKSTYMLGHFNAQFNKWWYSLQKCNKLNFPAFWQSAGNLNCHNASIPRINFYESDAPYHRFNSKRNLLIKHRWRWILMCWFLINFNFLCTLNHFQNKRNIWPWDHEGLGLTNQPCKWRP